MSKRYAKIKEQVQNELSRLYEANSGLRPSEVVESARPATSPLHDQFEWNNSKAGHEYRLMQARQLIRVTLITKPMTNVNSSADWEDEEEAAPERVVHVPGQRDEQQDAKSRESVYLRMSDVVKDDDLFTRALTALVAQVSRAQHAAQELRDAAEKDSSNPERMSRIAMAITALQTAGAAVAALH